MTDKPPSTPQEWESLIEDFQSGGLRLHKWASSSPTLLDHSLSFLVRKDFSFKIPLLIFLEEFSDTFFTTEAHLTRLLDALKSTIQSPLDGLSLTYHFKEQFMISTTSIFISTDALHSFNPRCAESLVELLLTVVHRPNHIVDRQTRAIACECLRQLEKSYPCLLSNIAGHLWSLCQSERTHACQSYLLLFTMVVFNIVDTKLNVSVLNTSLPLVPFNVPQNLQGNKEVNYKELRRAIAFLLESPQVLTPFGMFEFLQMIMPVALALDLQPSLLKVQFFGLVYSFNPLLCHLVLVMYSNFLDAFDGQEVEIVRRLMLMSKETQHYLVFRLLSLHWLLGLLSRLMLCKEIKKTKSIVSMGLRFYPAVFDPLALKVLKLDLLGFFSICLDDLKPEDGDPGEERDAARAGSIVKLFEDGLVSVSSFKWLPPSSTETAVAFRTFHKFLIGATSHSDLDPSTTRILLNSAIFLTLQRMLVDMTLEFLRLVPVVVSLIDRLLRCQKHRWLGERLLQMADEYLFPKVKIDYSFVSYFPISERIAENSAIPPRRLLDLLTKFMVFLVEKHGPDTGLKSWSRGSKVLCICRTMMMHHHSSRLFLGLSRLLAFTCIYFPDLEVRDNARIYLRMLICIPGMKLKGMLSSGEQLLSISPSTHSSSFYNVLSPRHYQNFKKPRSISSCIHLERVVPLLVKQTWTLSLSPLDIAHTKPTYLEKITDVEPQVDTGELEVSTGIMATSETEGANQFQQPLRVMDSKISEILGILRRHFSCIPDFRHMQGLRVCISCSLRLESDTFSQLWGGGSPTSRLEVMDTLPALYATVLQFSSSAPYGSIPSYHIPFLIGEPPRKNHFDSPTDSLDIVPAGDDSQEEDGYRAAVRIDLEPREPTPGVVDVFIEANVEGGQIIHGQLQNITVGIEDMFLKAIVPSDVPEDETPAYYSGLFDALWEACGASTNIGRETFPLKGGKGVAAINGTRSVKLLEVPADSLIHATERYLAAFVVCVTGEQLVNMVKDGGTIKNVVWRDAASYSFTDSTASVADSHRGPLHLTYFNDEEERGSLSYKRNLGCFLVLIFLPPRFHLLFQMEVSDLSTLVRIRTDHWPCLAYVDDYLEALFLT